MKKEEFVNIIKDEFKSKKEAKRILNVILDQIIKAVDEHDELVFHGFGAFKKKKITNRTCTDFKEAKKMVLEDYHRVYFKSGNFFKRQIR